jgi:BASS family bile acid:Na+ symporter
VANILFIVMALTIVAVLVISSELRASLLIGWGPVLVILILTVTAVVLGHLIGGPDRQRRAGVAIASLARNVGLALYIVKSSMGDMSAGLLAPILVYMLVGIVVQVAYSVWLKRVSATQ